MQLTPVHNDWQMPEVQRGAVGPQPPHASPPVPHSKSLCETSAMQVAPLQQPVQLEALHCGGCVPQWPWLQVCPIRQGVTVSVYAQLPVVESHRPAEP